MNVSRKEKERYGSGRHDADIDRDVSFLRSLNAELPDPEEPHPAYWNNFLLRVREQVDGTGPAAKRSAARRWWSPSLIWSSLAGVAALLVIAVSTDIIPVFGPDEPLIAEGTTDLPAISPMSDEDLLGLIDDLLDTSRIEAGRMDVQTKSTNLRGLVEDAADIIATTARDKAIDLATFIDPKLPEDMEVDPDRLRQVLLNLIGNAVKFTTEGGVGIFVEPDRVGIKFTIQDTGPGLSSEDCARVFDDFAQASTGSTRTHEGAGLGLSISRNLVQLMGGEILVESVPGSGSTFSFTIAAAKSDGSRAALPAHGKGSALVYMKNTPACRALTRTIVSNGFSVQLCDTEHQFYALAKSSGWNAAIADREGLQSEKLPELGSPLFLLGNAGDRHALDAQAGVEGWLTWPVRAKTLLKVLDHEMQKPDTKPEPDLVTGVETVEPTNLSPALNVLLAEDNPINAKLVTTLLTKLGHTVTHAHNGRDAADEYTRAAQETDPAYDLILMDLHMPVLDGIGAITEIRQFEVENSAPNAIIIVLSADGQQDVRDQALEIGADDFLPKPLDLDAISWLLRRKEQPEQIALSG